MKAVTHNIKFDLGYADALSAVQAAAGLGGIVFLQEISDADNQQAVLDTFTPDTWTLINADKKAPIAVKNSQYIVRGEMWHWVHAAREGITTERILTGGLVERTQDGQLLWLLNPHFISGAFSDHPGWTQEMYDWTLAQWNLYYKVMKQYIVFFAQTQKIAVLYGGDFNKQSVDPMTSYSTWIAENKVDHIGFTPVTGGLQLNKVNGTGTQDTASDHDALWADFYLGP